MLDVRKLCSGELTRSGKIASVLNSFLCKTSVSTISTFCRHRTFVKQSCCHSREGIQKSETYTPRAVSDCVCDVASFIGQHTLDSKFKSVSFRPRRKTNELASHANKTRFFLGSSRQQAADFSSHFRRSSFRTYTCDRLFVDGSGYLHIGFGTISFLSRVILSLCKHVKP